MQTFLAFTAAKFGSFPDSGYTDIPVSSKTKTYDGIENNIVLCHLISKKKDWRFNILHCRAGAFCNWRPPGAAQGHGAGQSQPLPAPAKGRIKEHSIVLPNITITLIHLFARFTYIVFFFFTFSNSGLQCYSFILMASMYLSPLLTFTMKCITVSKVN